MKLLLGYKSNSDPIYWDSKTLINGHMLLIGKSGSGKTHNIRKIIAEFVKEGSVDRIHVFDPHGDMMCENESVIRFSESSPYGINPMVISSNPEFGGIRKKIQAFFSIINSTSKKLGSKQEAALRNILIELFAANGFYIDTPKSWSLDDGKQRQYPKKYPNIDDAYRFANSKLKQIYMGTDNKTIGLLEDVHINARQLRSKLIKLAKENCGSNISDEDRDSLAKKADKTKTAFDNYLDHLVCEFDEHKGNVDLFATIKYGSFDVLKSVVEKLENLIGTGLFKSKEPDFDESKLIWRYDLKPLSNDEKSIYVQLRIKELYDKIIEEEHNEKIRTVFVVDEAHIHMSGSDNDNILNVLAKESRKFGVSLIAGSQAPNHFSEDFSSNVGCVVVLGCSEMHYDVMMRKFRVPSHVLENIVARSIVAVKIDEKTQTSNGYHLIAASR